LITDELDAFASGFEGVDLELALLEDGGKQVLKKDWQSGPAADELVSRYRESGLYTAVVGDENDARVDPETGLKSNSSLTRFVLAARERPVLEEAVELALVEMDPSGDLDRRTDARERLGLLLGYPSCCCSFYSDLDARNDEEAFYAAYRGSNGTVSGFNLFTGLHTISMLSHAPCSFTCRPSHKLAGDILELFKRTSPEAHDAYMSLSSKPLLYMGEPRRFLLDGEREDEKTIRYREVIPAHFLQRRDATDHEVLRILRDGDRVVLTRESFTVMKDKSAVWEADVRSMVRPPLLLCPGDVLSNRPVRVGLIETTFPGRHDLFGNMRLSLLAGDLKANGHLVRPWAIEQGPDGLEAIDCNALGEDMAAEHVDVVVFFRSAPPLLVESIRDSLPDARRLLVESGPPFNTPPDVEVTGLGRLPVLRLIDGMSADREPAPSTEPALYVPPDQTFSPELQRRRSRPRLEPSGHLDHWEVLGRLACPYRKDVRSNPLFANIDLDGPVMKRGCSMCSFRLDAKWPKVDASTWVDAICRQVAWIRGSEAGAERFRIVDHFSLQHIEALLDRFAIEGWHGITLLLDARVDHILKTGVNWDSIAVRARSVNARLDFTCIGFESFSQPELDRFNKGVSVERNKDAARKVRELLKEAPDVFINESEGAGFVTWTPWTTLDDLKEDINIFRELGFEDFRAGIASLRVRLYPDLPLYHLAKRDGLLLDEIPSSWKESSGYSTDHPWRFESVDTARAYALTRRLVDEVGEKGLDVNILDMAVRVVEKRSESGREGRAPAPQGSPVSDVPGHGESVVRFIREVTRGFPGSEHLVAVAGRLVSWRKPTSMCYFEETGPDGGTVGFDCRYPVTDRDHARLWVDTITSACHDIGLPDPSDESLAPVLALLRDAARNLNSVGLEALIPRGRGVPSLRLVGELIEDHAGTSPAMLAGMGVDPSILPKSALGRRLMEVRLPISTGRRAGPSLLVKVDRNRPSIMARAANIPCGPELFVESDELVYTIDIANPGRGHFLFVGPDPALIERACAKFPSKAFQDCVKRVNDASETALAKNGMNALPCHVGYDSIDSRLDPSGGCVVYLIAAAC